MQATKEKGPYNVCGTYPVIHIRPPELMATVVVRVVHVDALLVVIKVLQIGNVIPARGAAGEIEYRIAWSVEQIGRLLPRVVRATVQEHPPGYIQTGCCIVIGQGEEILINIVAATSEVQVVGRGCKSTHGTPSDRTSCSTVIAAIEERASGTCPRNQIL